VEAPAEQPLDPPGAVTFTGVALPGYQNVADFVVRMDTLEHVANSQLNTAELKRFSQPAVSFEVASEMVTIVGENGTEVRLEGGSQDEVAGGVVGPGGSSDLDEVANVSATARDQYAAEAGSVRP
jgi:hypothetical protein